MSVTVRQLTATEYSATGYSATGYSATGYSATGYSATGDAATRPTDERLEGFGALETTRGNLPLRRLDLRIRVSGLAADIELVQGFHNPYPEPLEATYIFPLPDRAAVTGMRMHADDRTIDGVLAEREQARKTYDQAVASGQRASIAEEERPDVFTMRVGNIAPGEEVTVTLRLAARLGFEDGVATLRFPLVVAPRFIPGEPLSRDPAGSGIDLDTDMVPDASRITPPVLLPGCPNPIDLSIRADIDPAGLPLSEVTSSLHPVTVDGQSDGAISVEVHPGERADRDFILRLALADEQAVSTGLSLAPDLDQESPDGQEHEGTFALTVLPPARVTPPRPRDVVLVLDRSGSMSGWKMVCARRAAGRIVDSLNSRDRFTVLAFDTTVETPADLPDGLVDATDRHRFRAVEHLSGLEARGGTQLLDPLLRAASLLTEPNRDSQAGSEEERRQPHTDRERTLVLVTDGQVGNEDQILRELADQISGVRVHTVGIDRAVNEGFLRRLATLGGGRSELVESEDHLDAAMEAIHRRVGAPLVTDVELAPEGLELIPETIAPHRLPAVYAGAPLVVHGRYRASSSTNGARSLVVSGQTTGDEPYWTSVPATHTDNQALHAVWARAHIRDLEDRYVTARRARDRDLEQLEHDIVATSLRFGVLSRFTAFVAVDQRVVNEGGQPRRVTQPVESPQGWEQPTTIAGTAAGAVSARGVPGMARSMVSRGPQAQAQLGPQSRAEPSVEPSAQSSAQSSAPPDLGRRSFAPSRRGRGRSAPEPVAESDELRALRASMATWQDQLRQAPPARRAELLAELVERLATLADEAERLGADTATTRPLRELVATLRSPLPLDATVAQLEFARRWLQTVDVVEAFVAGSTAPRQSNRHQQPGGDPVRSQPASRRQPDAGPFWKRR